MDYAGFWVRSFAYFVGFESSSYQATPGKMAVGEFSYDADVFA